MRFINNLQRKIGRYAIKNFIIYIIAGDATVWLLSFIFTNLELVLRLSLLPGEVFNGEVWRVVTFIFLNSVGSGPIFALLQLYFLYIIGVNLEHRWGSFWLNIYYLSGIVLTVAISLITGWPVIGAYYIHLSLFFAFAKIAPETRILLFFIVPIKIKWLAWAAWVLWVRDFAIIPTFERRLLMIAPIAVYLLFFWREIIDSKKLWYSTIKKRRVFRKKTAPSGPIKVSFHKCLTCGRTEIDSPDYDFRYCSKCAGNCEYCQEHLQNHEHIS